MVPFNVTVTLKLINKCRQTCIPSFHMRIKQDKKHWRHLKERQVFLFEMCKIPHNMHNKGTEKGKLNACRKAVTTYYTLYKLSILEVWEYFGRAVGLLGLEYV